MVYILIQLPVGVFFRAGRCTLPQVSHFSRRISSSTAGGANSSSDNPGFPTFRNHSNENDNSLCGAWADFFPGREGFFVCDV
jgi:hypothetical protein